MLSRALEVASGSSLVIRQIRDHLIYCLLVRRSDDCVDSSSSHRCSASSRPWWWCSNAPSMFPNSIKAFPIEACRFPKTSFLFGSSLSDHLCTVFNTSSAFFNPPFAFPDINSTMIKVQLRILNCKKKQPWVQAKVWSTFINVLQTLQQKSCRFRWGAAREMLGIHFLLLFPGPRLLLVPELSASVYICQSFLNDIFQFFPILQFTFHQI